MAIYSLKKRFWFFGRLLKDQAGGALVYTALLMPALTGFVGLGVDVALWQLEKRDTQGMADAAAIAAALEYLSTDSTNLAETAAQTAAGENGFDATVGDAITINRPPTSGSFMGFSGAIEVIVRTEAPQLFSSLVSEGQKFVSSRAVAIADFNDTCLWSLEPEDAASIKVSGGSQVEFACGIFANSSSGDAIQVSGAGSCLTGSDVKIVGGSNGGCISPEPVTNAVPKDDPLSLMDVPEHSGCDYSGSINITGGDAVLYPGVYCNNINIRTSGTVTFMPGNYILDGAGLSIGAGANVVGSELTFFITENAGTSDNISVSSGASVDFSAPTTGPYAGILFFQDRNSISNMQHNLTGGSNMSLTGILYFPNQDVKFAGGSETDNSDSMLIANTVEFVGNSFLGDLDNLSFPNNPLFIDIALVE